MKIGEKNWMLIFLVVILLAVATSAAAYMITGNKGIEERFSSATGLNAGGENEKGDSGSLLGFRIEGNILLYMTILAILGAACVIIYLKFKL
ncbi:MAG TPA: hypothetical protein VK436_04070 [Methanocella sp.]|nr:hypothetical protein [Methanocella sp.]